MNRRSIEELCNDGGVVVDASLLRGVLMEFPMNVSLKSNGNYEHIKNCVVSAYSHRRCCGVDVLVQLRRSGAT